MSARAKRLGGVALLTAGVMVAGSLRPALGVLPPACDTEVAENAEAGPNGYQWRGNRCEGVYRRPLAGEGNFLIASLTRGRSAMLKPPAPRIAVRWNSTIAGQVVHLRAYCLRSRLYYQMDADRPGPSGRYDWPTDVLTGLDIPLSDVAIVAWAGRAANGAEPLYTPVQLGPATAGIWQTTLVAVAGRELSEVYVRIVRRSDQHSRRAIVREKAPLRYGAYPAEGTIEIALPELRYSGLYTVELEGDVRDAPLVVSRTIRIAV